MNTSSNVPLATGLTAQQVRALKHQPDTGQGLRDQVLMCLLLNEKLSVKMISVLRVSAFEIPAQLLVMPDGQEELLLTDETFRTLREYVMRTAPPVHLIQASVSNGELSGGGMSPGAIYARVETLGAVQGLRKLTVEACHAYQDPSIPVPKPRKRAAVPASPASILPMPQAFPSPSACIDTLMGGLAGLEELLKAILSIQKHGNLTPQLESLCAQLDMECSTLQKELTTLQQIANVLPLHFLLLRLFPQRGAVFSESLLLKLEVRVTRILSDALAGPLPRSAAEEKALRECMRLVLEEGGKEVREEETDMLRGMIMYASMHVQRKKEDTPKR